MTTERRDAEAGGGGTRGRTAASGGPRTGLLALAVLLTTALGVGSARAQRGYDWGGPRDAARPGGPSVYERGYERGWDEGPGQAGDAGPSWHGASDPQPGGPRARPNWDPPFPLGGRGPDPAAYDDRPADGWGEPTVHAPPAWDPEPPGGRAWGADPGAPGGWQGVDVPAVEGPPWGSGGGEWAAGRPVSERWDAGTRVEPSARWPARGAGGTSRGPSGSVPSLVDRLQGRAEGRYERPDPWRAPDPGPDTGRGGPGGGFDSGGPAGLSGATLPGWHFRGDPEPPPGARRWGSHGDDPFGWRPLTDRERERMGISGGRFPTVREDRSQGVRPDPFEPGAALGFEPPWRRP